MRALIAITTCEKYRKDGTNDTVRDTWVPAMEGVKDIDYAFFTGRDSVNGLRDDEVRLDVADDYDSVPYKTIESIRWALDQGYDFIFRTYPDVYIRPDRLIAALLPAKAYVGYPIIASDGVPYASGGAGYWLRAAEAKYVLNTMVPYDWAEDRWVGHVMHENHVTLWADQRYSPWAKPILKRNEQITAHLSRSMQDGQAGVYKPQWMYNVHKFWTLSQNV